MTKTLSHLYDSYLDAEAAVRDLQAAGIHTDHIALLANNTDGAHKTPVANGNMAAEDAEAGATFGAVVGATAGTLAGLGFLAIPGLGPVVALGWFAATAAGVAGGAVLGGAGGGLVGAMTSNGVSETEANFYAEGVRRGGTLVTVTVDDSKVAATQVILRSHHVVNNDTRAQAYRDSGWQHFDPAAAPYTGAQLSEERRLYPFAK